MAKDRAMVVRLAIGGWKETRRRAERDLDKADRAIVKLEAELAELEARTAPEKHPSDD